MASPASSSLTSCSSSALSVMDTTEFPCSSDEDGLLSGLPRAVLHKILHYLDRSSLGALSAAVASPGLALQVATYQQQVGPEHQEGLLQLDGLPSELLLHVFGMLDRRSLGRAAQTCRRFRELAAAECLWLPAARGCLATGGGWAAARSAAPLPSSRDAVRVSANWRRARYEEAKLLVHNMRYMPRLQLERELLWVSRGNTIWAHPRKKDGTISRTTTRYETSSRLAKK